MKLWIPPHWATETSVPFTHLHVSPYRGVMKHWFFFFLVHFSLVYNCSGINLILVFYHGCREIFYLFKEWTKCFSHSTFWSDHLWLHLLQSFRITQNLPAEHIPGDPRSQHILLAGLAAAGHSKTKHFKLALNQCHLVTHQQKEVWTSLELHCG